MKTAGKWIGWTLLALVALYGFGLAGEVQRWLIGLALVAFGYYYTEVQAAEQRHKQLMFTLDRLEGKLDRLVDHPLNTRYVSDGIEGLVDEYRQRTRVRDPHEP